MHRTTSRPLVALLLTLGAAVTGCRDGGGRVAAEGAGAAEPTTTSTAAAPTSTSSSLATTTTRARPSTTAATTSIRPTTTRAGRPKVVVPQQGDRVVAVFVASGPSLDGPSFTKAKARLASLGYNSYSGGDTACSRGAEEALPQLEEYSLSLEFATRGEADRFAALYGTVVGIAAVTVYCAD